MVGFLTLHLTGKSLKEIGKIVMIVLIIWSCNRADDYVIKNIKYRSNSKQDSVMRAELIRKANDSILKWIEVKYKDVSDLSLYKTNWDIDSFIVFNANKNRAMGIILKQWDDTSKLDAVKFLNFEQKGDKWFVFFGATMVLPRNCYNKPNVKCKPIPMDSLRELGRRELLGIYYAKKWPWSSEYVINERWFREEFEGAMSEQGKKDWISGKSRKRLIDTTKIPQ